MDDKEKKYACRVDLIDGYVTYDTDCKAEAGTAKLSAKTFRQVNELIRKDINTISDKI